MGNTISPISPSDHLQPLLEEERDPGAKSKTPSLEVLIFQINSFFAVLWPVLVTILLSSVVACHVQDSATKQNMLAYLYFQDIDESSDTMLLKSIHALFNGLIVIAFIAIMTFLVVGMYKFNCMCGLVGYLMFSSSMLLGFIGFTMVQDIVVSIYHLPVDIYSAFFIMYNFAIVGTVSIFYQRGVSPAIGRGYLIVTSVIMAWQLSQWPEWSVWTILCLLAFWDLFAVLTPCGPLRCLVNLISTEGRPMPGLLYEADVHKTHLHLTDVKHQHFLSNRKRLNATPMEIEMQQIGDSTHEGSGVEKFVLREQLRAFYMDFNPENLYRVDTLVELFHLRQMDLWITLINKYNVKNYDSLRPYAIAVHEASMYEAEHGGADASTSEKSTIKLGLGDFIFYSVLVARAAMHGFSVFVSCLVCVIMGLLITMYLLSRYQALPALPISILLAVTMFGCSVSLIVPFISFLTDPTLAD